MSINQPQVSTGDDYNSAEEDTYIKLVQVEQEHTRTRWTVATFFMSISFALFGFSFQNKLIPSELLAMRLSALFIYWFALALFWRFATFSEYLGVCQRKLKKTRFKIHEIEEEHKLKFWKGFWHRLPSKWLLFGFGIFYILGVIVLGIFGL
jgi:hypothetical protein